MKRITTGLVLVGACLFAAAFGAGFAIYLKPVEASRNSSGTMSLATPGVPFQSNQTISSTQVNNTLSDIATELTNSLERNGKGGMLSALRGIDGTVAAPAFSWTSDTSTGEYRIGSGDLGWSISGTKKLELTSSLFTIVPNASFSGALTGGMLDVQTTTGLTSARFMPSGTQGLSIIQNASFADVGFNVTNNSTNFLYATTNPAFLIEGSNTGSGTLAFDTAPSGTAGTAATFTQRMIISPSGVTIGASGTAISASFAGLTNWTPGSVSATTCTSTTITLTGATGGADCTVNGPSTVENLILKCNVTANTCNIGLCNPTAGSISATAGNYLCRVFNR